MTQFMVQVHEMALAKSVELAARWTTVWQTWRLAEGEAADKAWEQVEAVRREVFA